MIWLTGCNGMLGTQVKLELEAAGIPIHATDVDVDITDRITVRNTAARIQPDWIINCAAYTDVDQAESDSETAYAVNAAGPENLALTAAAAGAKLIHFSTDYVFDGTSYVPYRENDPVSPLSVYGQSKLAGENAIREHCPEHFIFRISWLYGVHGSSFVDTMLTLFQEKDEVAVVDDQWGSPTWCGQLARNIVRLISRYDGQSANGTFHYQDSGALTWYQFASAIYEIAQSRGVVERPVALRAISSRDFPTAAHRPANSRFNTRRASRLPGFEFFHWRENLEQYFDERRMHFEGTLS